MAYFSPKSYLEPLLMNKEIFVMFFPGDNRKQRSIDCPLSEAFIQSGERWVHIDVSVRGSTQSSTAYLKPILSQANTY